MRTTLRLPPRFATPAILLFAGLLSTTGACSCNKRADRLDGDGSVLGDGAVLNDGATGDGATNGDGAVGGDGGGGGACVPLGNHCGTGIPCECEDCVDNDGDLLLDVGRDPECTSYLDDDESSFATGLPGDNRDANCQDCFFDGDSGGCQVQTSCVTTGMTSPGATCGAGGSCSGAACVTDCLDYVPNGCDCFGCCDIEKEGTTYHVLVGSACDFGDLSNGSYGSCTQCVPSTGCVNTCATCELCLGKTIEDLPPECFMTTDDAGVPVDGGSGGATCVGGNQICGDGLPACAPGDVCVFGCCLVDIGG